MISAGSAGMRRILGFFRALQPFCPSTLSMDPPKKKIYDLDALARLKDLKVVHRAFSSINYSHA